MPIVDGVLIDAALLFLTFGGPAIAFAVMLYLTDRDRNAAAQAFDERHAALGSEHAALLHALEFDGLSSDERNRRIAAMKDLVNDAQTWLDYVRSLPPEAASHLMQNVTPQDLVRLLALEAEWSTDAMEAALQTLHARLTNVAHMDVILRDERAQELQHITPIVERSLWMFEPDFVVGADRRRTNNSVRTVARELYQLEASDGLNDTRPDLVARSRSHLSLQPGHQWQDEDEGTLLLELKNAKSKIGTADQTQASGYIRQLVRAGALPEREPVDCYVIGGDVHDHDGGPRIEGWYHNIRITSLSYDQLIERAKCLTLGVYDRVKDVAPFVIDARRDAAELLSETATVVPLAAE